MCCVLPIPWFSLELLLLSCTLLKHMRLINNAVYQEGSMHQYVLKSKVRLITRVYGISYPSLTLGMRLITHQDPECVGRWISPVLPSLHAQTACSPLQPRCGPGEGRGEYQRLLDRTTLEGLADCTETILGCSIMDDIVNPLVKKQYIFSSLN